MKTFSVRQFKACPSRYFAFVQAGLKVLLLSRKKPIAILEPVTPEDDEDAYVKKLVKLGIAKRSIKRKTGSKMGATSATRTKRRGTAGLTL